MRASGEFWNIAAAKNEAEIDIFGVIGDFGFWEESVAATDFIRELRGVGAVSRLNINLYSEGGSVFDGIAIYNAIRQHKMAPNGERVVHVSALAASIATVVMLAGDRVEVAPEAEIMIHNPWGMAIGEESDMRMYADRLTSAKQKILQIYHRHTGTDLDQLSDLMDGETWMRGEEIKAAGFADVVKEDVPTMRVAAGPLRLVNKYKNTPPEVLKRKPAKVTPEVAARLQKLGIVAG